MNIAPVAMLESNRHHGRQPREEETIGESTEIVKTDRSNRKQEQFPRKTAPDLYSGVCAAKTQADGSNPWASYNYQLLKQTMQRRLLIFLCIASILLQVFKTAESGIISGGLSPSVAETSETEKATDMSTTAARLTTEKATTVPTETSTTPAREQKLSLLTTVMEKIVQISQLTTAFETHLRL
ncbi:hypothetical protein KIN20_030119 [Parelaphostrongylus tenuis]|uniref:Uncharacterized protein n=1 Tax=Parelaphostrongylus tenuis TaxID=148309 RepID=A0AAD5WFW8_PARTN|nr:hypothetical protein KIN20_030119 [Parelaphostrongylus tenuis]